MSEIRLKKLEWMLSPKPHQNCDDYSDQGYGDLTKLNSDGIILKTMGKELLRKVAEDYLGLLGTSSAIYEVNGDYAFGIFASRWCRAMDCASRKLCDTSDNAKALNSGKWLCHESCWTDCARIAIAECRPMDIECKGGIRMYCEPIMADDKVVGAINFGYGDPPQENAKLQQLADDYHIQYGKLLDVAQAYESRPLFIIEQAKKHLHATAMLIGSMVEKNLAERKLEHLNRVLLAIRNVNQLITKEKDHGRLIQGACENLIETRGYHSAWVALLDQQGKPRAAAEAGLSDEFCSLKTMLNKGDKPYCLGICLENPGVKVISSPRVTCGNCPLIAKYDNLSAMSVRLEHGGIIYGLLSVSVPFDLAHDESEHSLFQEVADDVAFGLHNLEGTKKQNALEENLKASEQKLRSYIENAPDGVFIADENGKYLEVNPAACRITGYHQEELLNLGIADLIQREYQKRSIEHFGELKEEGFATGEFGFLTKAGEMRFWEVGAVKLSEKRFLGFAKDITERKLAEDALRKNMEWLDETTRIASVGGWAIDLLGNTLEWTEETFRIHELPVGTPPNVAKAIEFYHPEDRPRVAAVVQRAMESGEDFDFEARTITAKKNLIWVRAIGHAVYCESGLVEVRGTVQDITEHKAAENALRESEALNRAIMDNLPLGLSVNSVDPTVDFTYMNDNFPAIYHTSRKSLSAKDSFWTEVYEDPDFREKLRKKVLDDCASGDPSKMLWENIPLTRNGKVVSYISAQNFPVPEKNLMVSLVWDVTEKKQAECLLSAEKERLAVTLRSIGDGVITTDMNGNVVLINNVAEQLTGWKQDEAQGQSLASVFTIIHEITRHPCENPVERVLSTGNVIELANHTVLISRDGTERIIADSGAPIKDKDGHTIGVVLVFRDMTEKQRFLEITQNSQKLESLGILAGGIAHDFNNLLGGIYGYIDMVAGEPAESERVSQYLSKAMSTIDRARDLTRQLLTFAKGGAPVKKVEKVFPFVQETAQFASSGSNVTCNFDVPGDLWSCNYDNNQFGQVIDNLVINAIQAMPMGGAIEVAARNITLEEKEHPVLPKGDYVRISIKDSGIGIPREMLSRIFDPFFTTKSKGHGLGLATCYSIMNRHGGCIDVDSDPGKGSVFHVYLPAAKAVSASIVKKTSGQHKGSGTFLVMDDEEVMREILANMIKAFGYDVVCMDNGNDAIEYFATEFKTKRPISGMIFDLTVPGGMGGMEAVAEVRKIDSKTPAFVASGYADGPVMKNPAEYGFTASICKPFRRAELMEMLEKHMQGKKSK